MIYDSYFKKLCGIIIPHAGKEYAGKCRESIFKNVNEEKETEHIIYISALHNIKDKENRIHILEFENEHIDYFNRGNINNYILNKDDFTEEVKKEHSYKWVKEELKETFKKAKILVVCPTPYSDLKNLANDIISYIFKKKNENKKILLIATTDLIHYGNRFNNNIKLNYPEQLDKWRKEENIIQNMLNNNYQEIDKELICGPYAIQTFMYISNYFKWNSRVIDYYDSSNYNKNLLEKYSINLEKKEKEFVSYVSIIYGDFEKDNILLPIDIILGFVVIKTIITLKLLNIEIKDIRLPKWNKFNEMTNGIFISTQINNKTNSCTGIFELEENNLNSSLKITKIAENSVDDSINRWKNPIKIDDIDKYIIKIEIIDNLKDWKEYDSDEIIKNFKLSESNGIFLKLYNNNNATYLPVVAIENKDIWSVEDYMNNLSIKAGGNKEDWKIKGSKIKKYNSISFKYINETDTITVL